MNTEASNPAESHLRTLLRILAALFVLAAFLYELGPLVLPNRDFFQQLPFVSNSVVKVSILLLCCLYAAGDLRRRLGLVAIVIAAHLVSVAAMLLLLALADTSRLVDPGIGGPQPVSRVLWGAIALDGVITLLLAILYLKARKALGGAGPPPADGVEWLSPAEQWLRRILRFLGVVFILGALIYELSPLSGLAPDLFRELPFVTNSVVKVSVLAMVCWYTAKDLRRQMSLVGPVIAVHAVSCLAQLVYLVFADRAVLEATFVVAGRPQTMTQILWVSIGLDAGIGLLLFAIYLAAWKARLASQFLRPVEFRTLTALADIMIAGPDERLKPEEIAANVDRALARLRTERKGTFRVALFVIHYWPMLRLWPPLPELSAPLRSEYVKQRFVREAGQRVLLSPIRTLIQAFTRVGHQLSALGYYSDPRVHDAVGYVPFSRRPRYAGLPIPPRLPHPLKVDRPWDIAGDRIEADVCIVGSGAGGAILAYSLAERGRQVLILERGCHVEPRNFAEDELYQVGSLYQGGMLQLSADYRFTVLQGNCVGGSTTVNNAICFPPPAPVIEAWNHGGAGLATAELERSTGWVRDFLNVHSLDGVKHHSAATVLAPVLAREGTGLDLLPPAPFDANIAHGPDGCFGCGYCNIGCAFGKKLSMLDTTLPNAQRDFPGRVRILAECEVERLRTLTGRPNRVLDLQARLSDGRRLTVSAKTVVLSAGAIGSSYLLLASGIGRGLPVGRHLAFNMLTPVFAEFDRPMNSYDGIQMGHYMRHRQDQFIVETWFNPPVGLATAMGGWFEEHYRNMRRAGNMVAYGMVVGTNNNARVVRPLTGGSGFCYTPEPADMARLSLGLEKLGSALLEAGARRVLLNTWDSGVFESRASLERIARIARDPRFITVASSHPQGGNGLNRDPALGVVDPDFRVHGYGNLYVCDASVFPGSVQVNPQMTIMTLARYAAQRIQ